MTASLLLGVTLYASKYRCTCASGTCSGPSNAGAQKTPTTSWRSSASFYLKDGNGSEWWGGSGDGDWDEDSDGEETSRVPDEGEEKGERDKLPRRGSTQYADVDTVRREGHDQQESPTREGSKDEIVTKLRTKSKRENKRKRREP